MEINNFHSKFPQNYVIDFNSSKEISKAVEFNHEAWQHWAAIHPHTAFYNLNDFLKTKSSLHEEELGLLGNIKDKKILHLQCHFGQDTLSLAHLGAQVTGVDFSSEAIKFARQLGEQVNIKADFIESDVLQLNLNQKFDLIFTSYGVLNWLPDLHGWANVIAKHLLPEGRFVMVEFHPLINITNDDLSGFNADRPYSSHGKPIIHKDSVSYADPEDTKEYITYEYHYGLGDIIEALRAAQIKDIALKEYDYSNYACYPGLRENALGKFDHPIYRGPLMFSINASFI